MVNIVLKDGLFTVIDRHSDGTFKKRLKFTRNDIEKMLSIFSFEQLEGLRENIQTDTDNSDYIIDEENNQSDNINNDIQNIQGDNEYVFDIGKHKKKIIIIISIVIILLTLLIIFFSQNHKQIIPNNNPLSNQEIYDKINALELSKIEADNKYQKEILIINNQILILKDQLNINNSKYLIDKKGNEIIQKIDEKFIK